MLARHSGLYIGMFVTDLFYMYLVFLLGSWNSRIWLWIIWFFFYFLLPSRHMLLILLTDTYIDSQTFWRFPVLRANKQTQIKIHHWETVTCLQHSLASMSSQFLDAGHGEKGGCTYTLFQSFSKTRKGLCPAQMLLVCIPVSWNFCESICFWRAKGDWTD